MCLRPARPRSRTIDAIDVGFRVSATLAGLGISSLQIAAFATSPFRSIEWMYAAIVAAVPMAIAFVFALMSWSAMNADRRVERAGRMPMSFSPVRRTGTTRE